MTSSSAPMSDAPADLGSFVACVNCHRTGAWAISLREATISAVWVFHAVCTCGAWQQWRAGTVITSYGSGA